MATLYSLYVSGLILLGRIIAIAMAFGLICFFVFIFTKRTYEQINKISKKTLKIIGISIVALLLPLFVGWLKTLDFYEAGFYVFIFLVVMLHLILSSDK